MKMMKNKAYILACFLLFIFPKAVNSQNPVYTYSNGRIAVKQGTSLDKLKNPFVGGFQLPQFSALDLNLDGILDLLIFDRETKKFYTFTNDAIPNKVSYTYTPQYEAKLPECYNFCLSYDYNNDGKMDLFIEGNGYILQYRNTSIAALSFATADTLFDYNGINVYCPSPNIPSFNDIDNDGDMDILSWDAFGATITLYKNWRVEKNLSKDQWKYKLVDECWGKFNLFNSVQLGYHCQGIIFYPNGDDYMPPPFAPNGGGAHQGSTLLTLDIDSDGDYDALEGDIYYNYLYFLKNGKKDFNYPKDTMISSDSLYPSKAEQMAVQYFPAAYFLDVDNDGKRDILVAPNDGSVGSKSKDQIYFYKNTGTDRKPVFKLIQKNFLQETTIDLGSSSAPAFVDIDNDGDSDLFIATHGESSQTFNSHDAIVYYKNTGTLMAPVFELLDTNFLNLYFKNYSGIKPCFGDLNGDGKKDLLFGEANGLLKYYVNTTSGSTPSFTENTSQFGTFQGRNYTAPFLVDYDRDGKLDLFLGNFDGTVSYFINTGTKTNPVFTKSVDSVGRICVRLVDEFRNFYGEGLSSPVVADLDNDGKFDLLVGGKYGLYLYNNIENKLGDSLALIDTVVHFSSTQLATNQPTGYYAAPAIAQLDSDAVPDIMLGNNGGGVSVFSTYIYLSKFGINSFSKPGNKLSIKPNPASGTITIEGFENEIYSLVIYDVTGKQVIIPDPHLNRKATFDISLLQQGVYFISLSSKNGETYNGKFVKM